MARARSLIAITTIGFGLLMGLPVPSAHSQVPQAGPRPPEVRRELPPGCGFIPPRIDLSHLAGKQMPSRFSALAPPTQWDWRTQGKVTSVKNQSTCGACYAFASLGNIESKMLIDGEGTFDFSENNAKECNWYDRSCSGGNYHDIANWLSKKGVVLESCDPYVASNVSCNSSCAYIKTLTGWNVISSDYVPATTDLQNYIYSHGPIYTALYAGDDSDLVWSSEFHDYDGLYTLYYDGVYATNHAVLIVGWDDALPHAGGTGAWIVKNSWGTGWGGTCGYGTEGGYFTIAYGSANIGMWSSYMDAWQDYNSNGELLYYDERGYSNYWGYGSVTAWGLCKFVLSSTMYLTNVEFWTTDVTTDIDVYVYDDFNGSTLSNLIVSKLDTSFDEAGYHSVAFLDSAPQISAGEDVYVAVKFTNSSYIYPVVSDQEGPDETATTYISSNGSSWYDLGLSSNDVAIRVRTSPTLVLSVNDSDGLLPDGFSLSHNYPNPFNPGTTINYTLPMRSHVNISIYNLLGQRINTVVDRLKSAGEYTTYWDGTGFDGKQVSTGVYFYRLQAGDYAQSKKMLLLK